MLLQNRMQIISQKNIRESLLVYLRSLATKNTSFTFKLPMTRTALAAYLCVNRSALQRQMAQNAFDRWWWPTLMMFGPSDKNSPHSAELLAFGIKLKSNDLLRQRFIDMTVPQAKEFGLTIPDPDLRFDEQSGSWCIGEIDWSEFRTVIAGNGPCNKERLATRQRAFDDGAWVREAAAAYATKQRALKDAA